MVVLVTGAGGQLGQAIKSLQLKHSEIIFYFVGSAQLDITDKQNIVNYFENKKIDFCINAAAYTAVDKAESEPERAFLINVTGAKNLAEVCRDFDCTLLHISTDFVFDGKKTSPYTEKDLPNPINVYGKTKLAGEQTIQDIWHKHFIIRTSWLYSKFGNNFMKTMLRLAQERTSLSVVNDQIGTPTNTVDLVDTLLKIIISGKDNYGIYNFSNQGEASWYDFARKIFDVNNVSINLAPIPTSAYHTPAKRPKYSVLDKNKIKEVFNLEIKDWKKSLIE